MWRRAAVGLVMVLVVQATTAAQVKRTTILGLAPYELGASQEQVLKADPALRPSADHCTSQLVIASYGRRLQLALNNVPYAADLSVDFWSGKVGCVFIQWKISAFGTLDAWRAGFSALYNQLISTYDLQSLTVKGNVPPFGSGMALQLIDSGGNELSTLASRDRFDIVLFYLWGPFRAELEKQGPPPSPKF